MDITMPVMNGYEATKRIRAIELARRHALPDAAQPDSAPATPGPAPGPDGVARLPNHSKIFALTGLATADDKRQAFGSGVDGL